MKSFIATVCIASVICGYFIGVFSSSSSARYRSDSSVNKVGNDRSGSLHTRTGRNSESEMLNSILGGRSISEISTAGLTAIIVKLMTNDPKVDSLSRAEQSYQLQILLSKLSVSELTKIVTELNSNPETKDSEALNMVICALAVKDPNTVITSISKLENSSKFYILALKEISKTDPTNAASLLRSAMLDGKISNNNNIFQMIDTIGHSSAKLGVNPFFSLIDSLPANLQPEFIKRSITKIPEKERIDFANQLYQRCRDGRLNMEFDYFFYNIASLDVANAAEWYKKLPDSEYKKQLHYNTTQSLIGNRDKEVATKWIKETFTASPEDNEKIIKEIIMKRAFYGFSGIPNFNDLIPDHIKFTAADFEGQLTISNGFEGTTLTAFANAFTDQKEKSIFVANTISSSIENTEQINQLTSNDFQALSQTVSKMGFTGENATRVNEALEAAGKAISAANK